MKKLAHIRTIPAFATNTFAASVCIACGGRINKTNNDYDINYFITDHLGSTRVIIDNSGNIRGQYNYYPFGKQWEDVNLIANTNRYTFSGKEKQTIRNLNFLDFGARMYDSEIGRWFVQDTLQEKFYSWSSYNYCLNNPLKFVDIDGKQPFFFGLNPYLSSPLLGISDPIILSSKPLNIKLKI